MKAVYGHSNPSVMVVEFEELNGSRRWSQSVVERTLNLSDVFISLH